MTHEKLELLAPAGGFQALKAAVANGADAVYLGGGLHNARKSAHNFSSLELKEAFAYAHERGVKVYITLNTLLKDGELEEALTFAGFCRENGADAVIVQDLGLARRLHLHFPDLRLHASTQMTIHNSQGVKACEEMGFTRVVLARELSLKQIEAITRSCDAEIEVFVHGALCVSFSGQCLMSSLIGARSGNRGMCAQPCRLPWQVSGEGQPFSDEAYFLSPRDLMGITLLPELKQAGITSLKIEGRMKSPEYVAVVTGIYRKYLNRLEHEGCEAFSVDGQDLERLEQIFNRGGFTSTYYKGDRNYRDLIYEKHPKNRGLYLGRVTDARHDAVKVLLEKPLGMGDGIEVWDREKGNPDIIVSSIVLDGRHERFVPAGSSPWLGDMKTMVSKGSEVWRTYSRALMEEASESYERGEVRKVPVQATFVLMKGERAHLVLSDGMGNRAEAFSVNPAEEARERPLSRERIEEQLRKTGDTPYSLESVEVRSDGLSTLPVSALNAMRREAVSLLREKRIGAGMRSVIEWMPGSNAEPAEDAPNDRKLAVCFLNDPLLTESILAKTGRIYVPLADVDAMRDLRSSYKGEIYVWTPAIVREEYLPKLLRDALDIQEWVDGFAVGNPGTMRLFRESEMHADLHADTPMNLFNASGLMSLQPWGITSATLSGELSLEEILSIKQHGLALEANVYGQIQVMTLEYCPGSLQGACNHRCRECPRREGVMKDRKGVLFPYRRDERYGITRLYNQAPLFMDDLRALEKSPLSLLRLTFTKEDPKRVDAVVRWFWARLSGQPAVRETESLIADWKASGITKGHWFRGV